MKAFALFISLLFLIISSSSLAQEDQDYSQFPENTYWVNTEYKLAPATFKDKILVVLFWDMLDPMGNLYFEKLEDLSKRAQHLQLVSIVVGDEYHPSSLSDLKAFVQDNAITHPFGIAGDLKPFVNIKKENLPKVFIYTKEAADPTIYSLNGELNINQIIYGLEKLVFDRDYTKDYSYWQLKPSLAPQDYAMPILSYPSVLSKNEVDKTLFVAENSQNRIAGYSLNGTLKDLIGGNEGDEDGSFGSAKIGTVSGMDYDPKMQVLYFVDATANKIKGANFYREEVSEVNFIDKSKMEGIYVDVIIKDTSIFVLAGNPARITEFGLKGKVKLSEFEIQKNLRVNESVYKLALGQKVIYVITTHGRIFKIKDGILEMFYSYVNWEDAAFDLVEDKKSVYLLKSRKNEVVKFEKGKSKVVFSTPMIDSNIFDDVHEDIMKLPHSMCSFSGELLISDLGNNLIRRVNVKKKKASILKPIFSEDMSMSKDAVAVGEQVYFEQTIFGSGTNQVEFVFELAGLKIYKEGRNEIALEESGGIQLVEGGVTDKGFSVRIAPREDNNFAQMELYLTLYDPAVPEVIYFKRAVLNIEYEVIPGEETSHSMLYRPNIKAY
jgi:hypothetical protein